MNIGTIATWIVIAGFLFYGYIKFKPEIDKAFSGLKKKHTDEKSIDERIIEVKERILKQKKLNELEKLEKQLNNETFK